MRSPKNGYRICTNKHMAVLPHLQPDPFTYLLTKFGTCTPTHENTPSARAHPDNKNMTIHTFTSWGVKKKEKTQEKQPV